MDTVKKASCHCGAVEFQIQLPTDDLGELRRCNCSLCRKKGAVMASVPLDKLVITRGVEYLTLYQWNTGLAKHYFCKICGIYTHHQRRSAPKEFAFNITCLEPEAVFDEATIVLLNGAANSLAVKKHCT